jgi:hypothetical protein
MLLLLLFSLPTLWHKKHQAPQMQHTAAFNCNRSIQRREDNETSTGAQLTLPVQQQPKHAHPSPFCWL